jgi:protein gp37
VSDGSAIEWTDATWNPVTGCTKVSPGCDHCYAYTFAERWRGVDGHYFAGGFDMQLRPEKLGLPLRWRRPRRVFVNSMSDLFHATVPAEYIAEVFAVMAATPHTFQILTKRHGRMRSLLGDPEFRAMVQSESATLAHEGVVVDGPNNPWDTWPLHNVWLGVSVENQRWADLRIPALIETPSWIRWLSCEPLIGPVDLDAADRDATHDGGIDWVVAGGESGAGARPVDAQWVRSLRDQCTDAGVPFFFKQWGGRSPKSGGRTLDGRTWDELPAAPRGLPVDLV